MSSNWPNRFIMVQRSSSRVIRIYYFHYNQRDDDELVGSHVCHSWRVVSSQYLGLSKAMVGDWWDVGVAKPVQCWSGINVVMLYIVLCLFILINDTKANDSVYQDKTHHKATTLMAK